MSPRSPLGLDRLAWLAAVLFGGWTLLCQGAVLVGASLRELLLVVAVVSVAGLVWVFRRSANAVGTIPDGGVVFAGEFESRIAFTVRVGATVLGLALAGIWWSSAGSLLGAWWVFVLGFAAALWFERRGGDRSRGLVDPSQFESWALLGLCVVCAALTLLSSHASLDDAFYVNVAVHAAQEPSAPLLARDTIFGFQEMPLQLPIYKLHSIEVLGGAISYLTGMRAILSMHWVIATLAAFLVPLAQARFFRRILPQHWLGATLIASMAIFAWGGDTLAVGNFGFVRLYHGKGIFATVFAPLLLTQALDFMERPGFRAWGWLLLLQVGSVGMTWIALALAPFLVVVALLAGAVRNSWKYVGWGASTCLYAIIAGWLVRSSVRQNAVQWESVPDAIAIMTDAVHLVIGHGAWLAIIVVLSGSAWLATSMRAARRLLLLLPMLFLLTFFNPWLVPFVAEELGNHTVYPRVFWALPLPLLVAAGFYVPWSWWSPRRRWLRDVAAIGLAVVVLHLWMPQHTLSSLNGTSMGWPRAKVEQPEYDLARLLVEYCPEGKSVLAPSGVAGWVSTFEDHPAVIFSCPNYAMFLEWHVGKEDSDRRRGWSLAAERKGMLSMLDLRTMVESYDLGALCLEIPGPGSQGLLNSLRFLGFERVGGEDPYSVWIIDKPLPPARRHGFRP